MSKFKSFQEIERLRGQAWKTQNNLYPLVRAGFMRIMGALMVLVSSGWLVYNYVIRGF